MDDKITAIEKVSSAMNSSNLKLRETDCPLDYVIATGMVAQNQPEASLLIRFMSNASSFKEVRQAAIQITYRLNKKRNWGLNHADIVRVGDTAVKMYLMPTCSRCHGRKYDLISRTPTLSAKPCHKCRGTGKRNYPTKHESHIRDVVQVMISIVDLAEKTIMRKTKNY